MSESTYSDLSKKTTEELTTLYKAVEKELAKRRSQEQEDAKARIVEIAIAAGINLSALGASVVFYRNPDNQFETWAGKGRKPNWLTEQLAKGKKLEDLQVK